MAKATPQYNWSFLLKFHATLASVNFLLALVGVLQILYVDASGYNFIITAVQLTVGSVLLLLALYYRGKKRAALSVSKN